MLPEKSFETILLSFFNHYFGVEDLLFGLAAFVMGGVLMFFWRLAEIIMLRSECEALKTQVEALLDELERERDVRRGLEIAFTKSRKKMLILYAVLLREGMLTLDNLEDLSPSEIEEISKIDVGTGRRS
jgi:hypothetical protein